MVFFDFGPRCSGFGTNRWENEKADDHKRAAYFSAVRARRERHAILDPAPIIIEICAPFLA